MAESQSITIHYDGNVIKTIEAGQIARMPCAGKGMESDVVVSFGTDGFIVYDGRRSAYNAGQIATIFCEGKKMKTDIVIESERLAGVWLLNTSLRSYGYAAPDVTLNGTAYLFDGTPFRFTTLEGAASYAFTLSETQANVYRCNEYQLGESETFMKSYRYARSGYGSTEKLGEVNKANISDTENANVRIIIIDTRYNDTLASVYNYLKANAVKIG